MNTSAINTHFQPNSLEGLDTKIVWVNATECLTSSSFDWYFDKETANEGHESDKRWCPIGHVQCHLFAFEVDANASNEAITELVDDFYYEKSRTKEFNSSELVSCYPFTTEAWMRIVNSTTDQR